MEVYTLHDFRINSWDNEKMQIYVDGHLWEARWGYTDGGSQLCGTSQNAKFIEKVYEVEFLIPHNTPTVTIIMTSTLDEEANNVRVMFNSDRNLGDLGILDYRTQNVLQNVVFVLTIRLMIVELGSSIHLAGRIVSYRQRIGHLRKDIQEQCSALVSTSSVVNATQEREVFFHEFSQTYRLITRCL